MAIDLDSWPLSKLSGESEDAKTNQGNLGNKCQKESIKKSIISANDLLKCNYYREFRNLNLYEA